MKALIHVTKECESVDDARLWYETVKHLLHDKADVHVNGQITTKFEPSHPPGTPEEGPSS